MTKKTYSLAEAAAIIGKNRTTVKEWLDRGAPYVRKADRSSGREWQLSIADLWDWYDQYRSEQIAAQFTDQTGQITKEEADRRRAIALAITAEVDAAQALDQVVSRQDAEADLAAFCQALRNGLTSAIARIASRATMITNAAEIQSLCQAEINRSYEAAQAELERRWTQPKRAA